MPAWRLVIEGDSGRHEARGMSSVFVDALRAQGHTVKQVTFYGDVERPGEDLTDPPVLFNPLKKLADDLAQMPHPDLLIVPSTEE